MSGLSFREEEVQLDIRQKEVVMEFRRWLNKNNLKRFSSDTFRRFMAERKQTDRLVDSEKHVNVGGYFTAMLKAKNPLHRIVNVGVTRSTIKTNKGRAIGEFKFMQP